MRRLSFVQLGATGLSGPGVVLVENGLDVEVIGSVGVDVFGAGGTEVGDDPIVQVQAVAAVGCDRVLEVDGDPQDAGVGDQGVAMRLDGLVVMVAAPGLSQVSDEKVAAEGIEGFAPVEPAADAAAEGFVGEPAERMTGALQLAVLDQGFGERVLS